MKLSHFHVALLSAFITCLVCLSIFQFVSRPTEVIIQTKHVSPKTVGQKNVQDVGDTAVDLDQAMRSIVQIKVARMNDNHYNIDNGSGMVVHKTRGFILTSYHVIESAKKIEVITHTGYKMNAELEMFDQFSDIAVLRVDGRLTSEVTFADSDDLSVGEVVYAIGSPFDLHGTLTSGVVSSKSRQIRLNDIGLDFFIQTDAAINPGNSGGALLNRSGEVVGLVAAILSEDGYYQGYSFAIHSNTVKKVLKDLEDFGSLQRAKLGIGLQEQTDANGSPIYYISDTNLTNEKNLRDGDLLIAIDGFHIVNRTFLKQYLFQKTPGETVTLTIIRDEKQRAVTISLVNEFNTLDKISRSQMDYFNELGMEVRSMTAKEKEMSGYKGVKVVSIRKGSPADVAQVQPNLIITHLENKEIGEDLKKINDKLKPLEVINLQGVYLEYPGIYPYKIDASKNTKSTYKRY